MTDNIGYNRNPNLPKAGVEKQFTDHEWSELEKCMDDPVYFAKTYFKIVHVDHGLIPFDLYDYQEKAIRIFQNHRNMIMCASRQCGKTSFATVVLLHTALFNKNKLIAILANKAATSKEILERVKRAYEYLPSFLKGGVKEWNKGSVEFENGSKIMAEASSSDNIRGKSVFLLYIDEHAFIENWDEFSASVLPTLSSGKTTKMIFTSTPHGLNHFYYYVEGARQKKNGFGYIEVPWWEVPGRDEEWKEKTLHGELNGDQQKFDQEYALEFIGSSGTLISGAALKIMQYQNPLVTNPHLYQYKEKDGNHQYIMTVDTSRGKGLDYSTFHVIDVSTEPYESVCVYRNNMATPTDFADVCYQMATYYNNAFILVELNDLGSQVADILFDYEMDLIFTKTKGRLGKQVSYESGADRGIVTTHGSKSEGCSMLKLLIEQNKLKICDKNTIEELKTFSSKGKGWEAEPGKHDDLVMCLVLFSWLASAGFIDQLTDDSIMAKLREKTEEDLESDLLPFGIMIDGHDDFEEIIDPETLRNPLNDLFN
jgi:hypothetical protein